MYGVATDDWKARILHARQGNEMRRGEMAVRTEIALAFRRLIQTVVEPAFREVAELAAEHNVYCTVECELGGLQPRGMFCVRPSGHSVRFQLDPDGLAVREIEGVYHRPVAQRLVWTNTDDLRRQLTLGYARSAAAAVVQGHIWRGHSR